MCGDADKFFAKRGRVMIYIHFFLNHKRLISFGFILAFFSSFGQTFLVSLYVPGIMKEFQLSSFAFGLIYGGATILSGLTLAFTGKFIDDCNLRDYTLAAVALLIAACLCIAFSPNLVLVILGFWGLRLAGQGLLTHISNTSIAKFFHKTRGMALSLSVLGFAAGEAFFPVTVGALIARSGWRASMAVSAVLIGLVLIPFVFLALKDKRLHYHPKEEHAENAAVFSRSWLWKDKRFYIIVFNSFVTFFTITGMFFYQLILAEEKGWTAGWLTASFMGFALGRTVFSLIGGNLVDKYSALRLFPLHLIPFAAGLSVLAVFDHPLAAPFYLILTGVSVGLGSTIKTALLAEVYGTRNLGAIRSVSATVMVVSTALSPVLFGFLLDHGFNFTFISAASTGLVVAAIFLSFRLPVLIKESKEPGSPALLWKVPA